MSCTWLGHAAHGVGLHHLAQLRQAELHVVEVLDGLPQRHGQVGQHGLEIAEGQSGGAAALGVHGLLGHRAGNEDHQTPVVAVHLRVEALRVFLQADEGEHAAVDVVRALLLQLVADMAGDGGDVTHHHIDIGEHMVVDAL